MSVMLIFIYYNSILSLHNYNNIPHIASNKYRKESILFHKHINPNYSQIILTIK